MEEVLLAAAKAIKNSNCLIFTAGAGMGVDSGLPDFRGKEGFWKAYPPMKHLGIDLPSTSNPKWFSKDPEFAWGFWAHRFHLYTAAKPHQGYSILKNFSQDKKYGHFIFTSNVDAHFRRVFDEDKIVECHGTVDFWQCTDEYCKQKIHKVDTEKTKIEFNSETFKAKKPLPSCPTCNKVARPNVLMFGDYSFIEERLNSQEKNYNQFKNSINEADDLKLCIIEIGAGSDIPTVRKESQKLHKTFGGTFIRINPREPGKFSID
jgi:NAD-dependent SIR2 family protein deacetylase